jgi:N-acetylmuramoyl-L-alanine amidase
MATAMRNEDPPLPVVVLSAGHQAGADEGAVWVGDQGAVTEHEIVSRVCWYTTGFLMTSEVMPVVVTVPTATLAQKILWVNDLTDRMRAAKVQHFLVEVHLNAAETDKARGVSVYHFRGNARTAEMGTEVLRAIGRYSWPSRGLKTERDSAAESLGWISKTKAWSLLVELGFLTNVHDRGMLLTSKGQVALASRLANGIVNAAVHMHSAVNPDPSGGKFYNGARVEGWKSKYWRSGQPVVAKKAAERNDDPPKEYR